MHSTAKCESCKFPFSWLLDWMERALSMVNHTGQLESCSRAPLDAANQESTKLDSNLTPPGAALCTGTSGETKAGFLLSLEPQFSHCVT